MQAMKQAASLSDPVSHDRALWQQTMCYVILVHLHVKLEKHHVQAAAASAAEAAAALAAREAAAAEAEAHACASADAAAADAQRIQRELAGERAASERQAAAARSGPWPTSSMMFRFKRGQCNGAG